MKQQRYSFLSQLLGHNLPLRRSFPLHRNSEQGLSLIELLVATLITSVVILIAGYGLIAALNGEKVAQATSARRAELNRAFDFMTNEIRMAQSINTTSFSTNGASTSLASVVSGSGLPLSALGSYGTLALYLEVPTTNPTAACPAPFDRIVYDIRPNPNGWLPPRTIHRYGRTPGVDGTIDPCSTPVSSDVLVDAIATTQDTTPVCNAPATLTGADGFMTCVNGAQVDLYLQSAVAGKSTRKIQSSASSRLVSITQAFQSIHISGNRTENTINFSWVHPSNSTSIVYELHRILDTTATGATSGTTSGMSSSMVFSTSNGAPSTPATGSANGTGSIIYSGANTMWQEDLSYGHPGDTITFWVEAKSGSQTIAKSNVVTFTK